VLITVCAEVLGYLDPFKKLRSGQGALAEYLKIAVRRNLERAKPDVLTAAPVKSNRCQARQDPLVRSRRTANRRPNSVRGNRQTGKGCSGSAGVYQRWEQFGGRHGDSDREAAWCDGCDELFGSETGVCARAGSGSREFEFRDSSSMGYLTRSSRSSIIPRRHS
jgi:hypothetical protein